MLELIVVVGVLSMLLAIVMPIIKQSRVAVYRKQAKVEATALAQAAIRYKAEYGFWPGEVVYDTESSVKPHPTAGGQMYGAIVVGPASFTQRINAKGGGTASDLLHLNTNEVFQAFCTVGKHNGSSGYARNPLNPKMISFLDMLWPETAPRGRLASSMMDFDNVDFVDPWDEPYRLIMGLNPRTRFTFEITQNGAMVHEVSVSNVTAFAFSLGERGSRSTNYIYSAGVVAQ